MGFLFFSFVILSLFASSVVVDGARPELVSSSVWYSNQTVLNVDLDVAVVRMEFDQPLYANGQTFLCASVDQSCPPVGCTPCDWSGQQVTFPQHYFFSFPQHYFLPQKKDCEKMIPFEILSHFFFFFCCCSS